MAPPRAPTDPENRPSGQKPGRDPGYRRKRKEETRKAAYTAGQALTGAAPSLPSANTSSTTSNNAASGDSARVSSLEKQTAGLQKALAKAQGKCRHLSSELDIENKAHGETKQKLAKEAESKRYWKDSYEKHKNDTKAVRERVEEQYQIILDLQARETPEHWAKMARDWKAEKDGLIRIKDEAMRDETKAWDQVSALKATLKARDKVITELKMTPEELKELQKRREVQKGRHAQASSVIRYNLAQIARISRIDDGGHTVHEYVKDEAIRKLEEEMDKHRATLDEELI